MPKLMIEVSHEMAERLESALGVRQLAGAQHGILDEFMAGVVRRLNRTLGDEPDYWRPRTRKEMEAKKS